jgi:DNA polymerase-3 subunit delta
VLPTKSKLRVLFEERSDTMAVACFREEAGGLEQTIRAELVARNVTIDPPALEWLTGQLGADYGSTRQELEKLALYVGPGGRVDVAAAMQCVGDSAALQLEDALFAAISGDIAGTDRALEAALAEGASPVGVLRMALTHLQRLQRARAAVDDRVSVADAVRALRPPIFVRRVGAFTAAVRQWSSVSLAGACDFVSSAERDCKRTGAPAEALCRNVLLSLARRASARSG